VKAVVAALVAAGALAAPAPQTFTGVVSDASCARIGHASMRMAPTDEECARACADVHGDAWVLVDGDKSYILSDQRAAEKFTARKVTVVGTLDASGKTLHVESIAPAR
jgi:hypothetical protein